MKKSYTTYIKSISLLIDILIINISMFLMSKSLYLDFTYFLYINVGWSLISFNTKFYKIHRFTKLIDVVYLITIQFTAFFFVYFAYFSIFKEGSYVGRQTLTLSTIFGLIILFKILFLFFLRKYRIEGGHFKNIVILGGKQSLQSISNLFDSRRDFGYRLKGYFSDTNKNKSNYLGEIKDSFEYIVSNQIDEVYCSVIEFSQLELRKIIRFGVEKNIEIKLVPESKGVFSNEMILEYYDYIPVLSFKKLPFDDPLIKYSKRLFDIIFSSLVLIFVLSWISAILFILIKLESKGPLFFKQSRDGLNGKLFQCYKFRSMKLNKSADAVHATKGDMRVTNIGRFIRKTSIDELPQFINVFKGEMSVVGPRPHMPTLTKEYAEVVGNYFQRNLVKPGVTGLAQIKGYRGNVETNADIENRVRLDIFYINNWSFLLDIKIILQTVINALKGEENAY